jgi:predicted MPP superfamily phosphohydrolase
MKAWSFIIFFSIVLLIYGAINFYIFRRVWVALEGSIYRTAFLYGFLFLVLAYPVGRLGEQLVRNVITESLVIIGSFYMAVMVYAFLFILVIDLVRLGNHFLHFFPSFITQAGRKSAQWTVVISSLLILFIVAAGYINTLILRVHPLVIDIKKPANGISELRAAVVSDIHLGTVIRSGRLQRIVDRINDLNPDIILLPGDIVDEDVASVAQQNMAPIFKKLKSRYGIYAITGNHEYFAGVHKAVEYMEKSGIVVLQDSVIKIEDAFYLAGRKDLMAQRMDGGRESLEAILQEVDKKLPVILMDHEPYNLESVRRNDVDLQLSGHTHHGQLFPFNYITKRVYELSWGYLKKGKTHYYVSCGIGTWGPPIRTNSVPEIVLLTLRFTGK